MEGRLFSHRPKDRRVVRTSISVEEAELVSGLTEPLLNETDQDLIEKSLAELADFAEQRKKGDKQNG